MLPRPALASSEINSHPKRTSRSRVWPSPPFELRSWNAIARQAATTGVSTVEGSGRRVVGAGAEEGVGVGCTPLRLDAVRCHGDEGGAAGEEVDRGEGGGGDDAARRVEEAGKRTMATPRRRRGGPEQPDVAAVRPTELAPLPKLSQPLRPGPCAVAVAHVVPVRRRFSAIGACSCLLPACILTPRRPPLCLSPRSDNHGSSREAATPAVLRCQPRPAAARGSRDVEVVTPGSPRPS